MIKRTLYFGNPTYLKLKNKQLSIEVLIEGENKTTEVSIEDIGIMVIDHPQITITSGLIQSLQENNVALIIGC